MKKYRDSIINIFKKYNVDPENEKPGIRWAFKPIKKETTFLILGINPSNSLKLVNSVIKKSADRWFTGKFKTQLEYDLFLANKENEEQITLLKELAHEHHPHFYKHKKFLNPSLETLTENNQTFQFFDLFPVWRKEQKDFFNELKDDQKRDSINAFIDLVDRHPNINSLLFLNGGAGKKFLEVTNTKWDKIKSVDVGKNKKVKEAKFKLSKRKIDIYCFPIGETRGLTDYNINELGKIFKAKLAKM